MAIQVRWRSHPADPAEVTIQRDMLEWLAWHGYVPVRVNAGMARPGVRLAPAGTADIIACSPTGRYVAIEVKRRKGRVRSAQQRFLEAVRQAGGVGVVARSVEELAAALAMAESGRRI